MGKEIQILERTKKFLNYCKALQKDGKLPSNGELATIMGYNNPQTITEIKGKRQNVSATGYQKFLKHFKLEGESQDDDPGVHAKIAALEKKVDDLVEQLETSNKKTEKDIKLLMSKLLEKL